jgi:hypothetical protein
MGNAGNDRFCDGRPIRTDATEIGGTLNNTTNTAQTATYTVTPKWVSGTETCTGSAFTVTVTVNPKPALNDLSQSACSGVAFSISPLNGTDGVIPVGTLYTGQRLRPNRAYRDWQQVLTALVFPAP